MPWANITWRQQLRPLEEQGYIIPAWNLGTTDYVACANKLAASIVSYHPGARICLMTNQANLADKNLFAYVHEVEPVDTHNAWANDWMVWNQTPFRETIKLEADTVAAGPIDHWWNLFRLRDLVISTGCRNWKDQVSTARHYRQCFDHNDLPDVYNAITYWRRSDLAKKFFELVKDIFQNWNQWSRLLKYPESVPSTDLVYAVAAKVINPDLVTLPFASYPKIVHMKRHHCDVHTDNWTQELVWEQDPLRIQTQAQWGLFHYHIKDWS